MGLQDLVTDGQLLVASLIAVAAGLVSFLSPCVLPLVPGYLAYVGATASADTGNGAVSRRRLVAGVLLFIAGFTAIFVAILSLAGSVGAWLLEWENLVTRVMGVLVILMGLVFIGQFGGMQRTARLKLKPRVGLAGAPALGAVFAIGWTPCMGPTLAAVMTLGLQTGSAGRAAVLGVAYCLGLGIPFLLAALGFGWFAQATTFMKRHIRLINIIGGALLIAIGILMVSGIWSQIMYSLQAVMGSYVPAL